MQTVRSVAAAGGLSPTLSIVVPLLAAFIGATAGGLARYWLDRRAERTEFRATVWVVGDDLGRLQAHLEARPRGPLGIPGHPSVDGDAWSALDRWTQGEHPPFTRFWNEIQRHIEKVLPDGCGSPPGGVDG